MVCVCVCVCVTIHTITIMMKVKIQVSSQCTHHCIEYLMNAQAHVHTNKLQQSECKKFQGSQNLISNLTVLLFDYT